MDRVKHYVCRRYRLYEVLSRKGFKPESMRVDMYNPKFNVWIYIETPELREAIEDYYSSFVAK